MSQLQLGVCTLQPRSKFAKVGEQTQRAERELDIIFLPLACRCYLFSSMLLVFLSVHTSHCLSGALVDEISCKFVCTEFVLANYYLPRRSRNIPLNKRHGDLLASALCAPTRSAVSACVLKTLRAVLLIACTSRNSPLTQRDSNMAADTRFSRSTLQKIDFLSRPSQR
jgi:hypothetical protein